MPSATRPSAPSRSTRWTGPVWSTWATCSAFAGDWKRGCELAEKARHLNPHHPAWYWALPFLDAYRRADYVTARAFILKANMPGQFFSQSLLAAVCGQLGERAAAEESVREVLALKPDFPQIAREEFAKWYPPELVERTDRGTAQGRPSHFRRWQRRPACACDRSESTGRYLTLDRRPALRKSQP